MAVAVSLRARFGWSVELMSWDEPGPERTVFLSTLPASEQEYRFARWIAVLSFGIFLLCAPFAQVKLAEVWAFIPSYQGAFLVIDLITATLLFAQFAILAAPSLLVLASGYMFTGLISIPHALSFPRLFGPASLIGGGVQTTAWLYMIWHAGFPLAVIFYASLRNARPVRHRGVSIGVAAAAVVALVASAAVLTTVGHKLLPAIMHGDGYTPVLPAATGTVLAITLLALFWLWKRRPHSVLDVWLMVVMSAWLFDIALSAMLNAGRFDFGFYAGRVYGLLSAALVLLVLLIETGAVYARLARSFAAETSVREQRLREVQAELIHVSRLTELGQMVSGLAHEVNQPLTAVGSYVRAGRRLVVAGDAAKADEALQKAADQVTRASQVIQRLRQFVKKADGQHDSEDVRQTIEEAAALALLGAEGRGVQLAMDFAADLPAVLIDKVQIQQVLLNLMRNAVEAMHGSSRRELRISTRMSSDDQVEVSVADSGPGLPEVVREKLFQPFVTTKPSGMGVGLSICRGIVEAHGGRMWLADRPGGGADFRFTLPVAGADAGRLERTSARSRA
jgi:signal transduction histidine kinase